MDAIETTRSAFRRMTMPATLARAWAPLAVLAATLGASLAPGIAIVLAAGAWLAGRTLDSLNLPLSLTPFAAPIVGAATVVAGVAATAGALALAGIAIHGTVLVAALLAAVAGGVLARLPGIGATQRPVRTAVIGSADLAFALATALDTGRSPSHRIVGFIADEQGAICDFPGLERAVGENRIELLVHGRLPTAVDGFDEKAPRTQTEVYEQVADVCLAHGVDLIDAGQLYESVRGQVPLGVIDGRWFGYLMHPRYGSGSAAARRALDIVVGSAIAIVAAPIVAIAAIAIKLTDGSPVIYRQRRVGAGGTEFLMPKLRTMVPDAEAGGEAVWCQTGDERITRVGHVLRRLHIDELPQLWCVLRGEMTLFGPRPERPQLTSVLGDSLPHYQRRHFATPGLTGWAQVRCGYAGSDSGSAQKLSHDLYYLKHRSIGLDLLILLETARILPRPHSYKQPSREERFIATTAPVSAVRSA
ncbi:MAG: sugar transferase [Solirubrobacterales bacterium]